MFFLDHKVTARILKGGSPYIFCILQGHAQRFLTDGRNDTCIFSSLQSSRLEQEQTAYVDLGQVHGSGVRSHRLEEVAERKTPTVSLTVHSI